MEARHRISKPPGACRGEMYSSCVLHGRVEGGRVRVAHVNLRRKEVWMEEPRRWALRTVKGRAASIGSAKAAQGCSPATSPQLNSAQKLLAPAICADTPAQHSSVLAEF